jgi:hypothetical protein
MEVLFPIKASAFFSLMKTPNEKKNTSAYISESLHYKTFNSRNEFRIAIN